MKIYTKTGDDGQTGLFGGGRVGKADPRVEAYGTVDEVNAVIGMARAAGVPAEVDDVLSALQSDLFVIGAELATMPGNEEKLRMPLISEKDVERLEAAIDSAEAELTPLASFILPGGHPGGAALHFARTVSRRAERRTLSAAQTGRVRRSVLVYLNRLSDLLFVLARRTNQLEGRLEVPWAPRSPGG